ncbi:MAG: hypothetical protein MUP47_10825 [Phycisphaerae bacterium]|nr:hypothetical protein [Phycisphaerae bacterium]
MQGKPICPYCAWPMRRRTRSRGNVVGIIKALLVLVLGLVILVTLFWTIVGAIIGLLMIILALGMGGTRTRVWQCTNCRATFQRA